MPAEYADAGVSLHSTASETRAEANPIQSNPDLWEDHQPHHFIPHHRSAASRKMLVFGNQRILLSYFMLSCSDSAYESAGLIERCGSLSVLPKPHVICTSSSQDRRFSRSCNFFVPPMRISRPYVSYLRHRWPCFRWRILKMRRPRVYGLGSGTLQSSSLRL